MSEIELKVTVWSVITLWSKQVQPQVLQRLLKDPHVGVIHGGWKDVLVYHGDDGGWCTEYGVRSNVYKWLEDVRRSAGFPPSGRAFYLLIKTE